MDEEDLHPNQSWTAPSGRFLAEKTWFEPHWVRDASCGTWLDDSFSWRSKPSDTIPKCWKEVFAILEFDYPQSSFYLIRYAKYPDEVAVKEHADDNFTRLVISQLKINKVVSVRQGKGKNWRLSTHSKSLDHYFWRQAWNSIKRPSQIEVFGRRNQVIFQLFDFLFVRPGVKREAFESHLLFGRELRYFFVSLRVVYSHATEESKGFHSLLVGWRERLLVHLVKQLNDTDNGWLCIVDGQREKLFHGHVSDSIQKMSQFRLVLSAFVFFQTVDPYDLQQKHNISWDFPISKQNCEPSGVALRNGLDWWRGTLAVRLLSRA